jgi:hypothetical protein
MERKDGVLGVKKLALVLSCVALIMAGFALPTLGVGAQHEETEFTRDFRLEDCKFKNQGENPYFILKPGYQLVFEGEEEGEPVGLVSTVLKETETINLPEIGKVQTRVLEERHTVLEKKLIFMRMASSSRTKARGALASQTRMG